MGTWSITPTDASVTQNGRVTIPINATTSPKTYTVTYTSDDCECNFTITQDAAPDKLGPYHVDQYIVDCDRSTVQYVDIMWYYTDVYGNVIEEGTSPWSVHPSCNNTDRPIYLGNGIWQNAGPCC